MKCPKCQSENPDTVKFCSECGANITHHDDAQPAFTKTLETPVEALVRGTLFADRYEIIEELGKGGMGAVYRVEDTKAKEEIALKLIKSEIAAESKTIERFRNELTTARKIRHRNVCGMYDLNEDKGTHFITMEYVPGEDLQSFLRRAGSLTISKAIAIAKQVCEGLSEAHGLGIVHRDLKPANIMIDKSGNARIMDFGIARSIKGKGISGAGVIIGTPEYMSPEQVDGIEADQRSDIYSFGVILYKMITGTLPFDGETPLSIAVQHRSDAPKNPNEINPQIPDDLNSVIVKCLTKEREQRYQSADELHSELENIGKGIPTTEREIFENKPLTSKEITVKFNVKKVLIPTLIFFVIVITAILIWRFILPTSASMNSIAVLPFEDLSPGKDQGHLAEGIPGTLINALSRIEGLRVPGKTSSFSLKGDQDIGKIGRRLGVETVLEGDIQVSGDKLRINVRLIKVEDGFQVWAEVYQQRTVDDVFVIQDDIAQSVVRELKVKFQPEKGEKLVITTTENNAAYNLFLQGIFHFRKGDESNINLAIEFFEKAIQEDQNFSQAYTELARSLISLSDLAVKQESELGVKAEAALERALELNDSLSEAHSVYGEMLVNRWEWENAEQEFNRSIELNPGSAQSRRSYSWYLLLMRRYEEAYLQAKKATEIDPLSSGQFLGATMAALGRYEEALEYLLNASENNPTAPLLLWQLALTYIQNEQFEKGIQTLKEQIKLMEGENISDEIAMLAYANARWGKNEVVSEYLRQLISYSEQKYVSPTLFAVVYGAQGNLNEAFKWLEVAFNQKDSRLSWAHYFWYDPIRQDPRFKEMLQKIGLDN
jgi:serine/threonine protein kinase/Tfp pilus assembly protein PilF